MYLISDAKSAGVTVDKFLNEYSSEKRVNEVYRIYKEYERELMSNNCLDFDDLLIKVLQLFGYSLESKNKYAGKFKYIHVDEFQDTNKVQLDIIKLLASCGGRVFAVGDDDQSIYGWRGAEIQNILNFDKLFPGAVVKKLEENYRSTQYILNAANAVIKNNAERMQKTLYTQNSAGQAVRYMCLEEEYDEAFYVANQIKYLKEHYLYNNSDFAIIMRVNALTRSFESELLKRRIPYKVFGAFKFFERKEIKDILAYLRIICNKNDNDALLRIINVPKRSIGDASIKALIKCAYDNCMSLYDVIMQSDNKYLPTGLIKKLQPFKELLKALRDKMRTAVPVEFLKLLLDESGINAMYAEDTQENFSHRYNIDELISAVESFSVTNQDSSIIDFLQCVTLDSDLVKREQKSLNDENDVITLATIHAVKGLEFKVVFIIGMDDEIFPSARSKDDSRRLEEERRLMYVAITRARERLFLTRANSRFMYGSRQVMRKSMFIDELGY